MLYWSTILPIDIHLQEGTRGEMALNPNSCDTGANLSSAELPSPKRREDVCVDAELSAAQKKYGAPQAVADRLSEAKWHLKVLLFNSTYYHRCCDAVYQTFSGPRSGWGVSCSHIAQTSQTVSYRHGQSRTSWKWVHSATWLLEYFSHFVCAYGKPLGTEIWMSLRMRPGWQVSDLPRKIYSCALSRRYIL